MEAIYQYLIVFITAIFVNNVVLSQILGICPFLGVSKKINTALGMSAAVVALVDSMSEVRSASLSSCVVAIQVVMMFLGIVVDNSDMR